MFILRAAFWLTLVVFLIPGGADSPRAGAIEALLAARGAIADIAGMCERQPDVCNKGGAALLAFGEKAKLGASLFYQTIDSKIVTGKLKDVGSPPHGTLRPEDIDPAWRDPVAGGKA
jgi:hypothetical protein